jgi:hypothetical protein
MLLLSFPFHQHRVSFRRKKNKDEVSPGPKKEEVTKPSKKVVEEKVRKNSVMNFSCLDLLGYEFTIAAFSA